MNRAWIMIGVSRVLGLIAPSHQRSINLMQITEHTVVVKLCAEHHVLKICSLTYILVGRICIVAMLHEVDDHRLAVHISPCRLIYGIVLLKSLGIYGTIVDTKCGLERKSGKHRAEIKVETQVKIEWSCLGLDISRLISIRDCVGCIAWCSSEQITSVNESSWSYHILKLGIIWVHKLHREKHSEAVGPCAWSHAPEVATWSVVVLDKHSCIGICLKPACDGHIYISAHVQAKIIVLVVVTDLDQTVIVHDTEVEIIVGTLIAATDLTCSWISIGELTQVVSVVVFLIGILIRIRTDGRVVDIALWISFAQTVIAACLIVESHVACSIKKIGVALGDCKTYIATEIDLHAFVRTTLGGDEYHTLGSTAAVESHSCCILKYAHAFHLRGKNVACLTRHSVNQDKGVLSPHAFTSVISPDERSERLIKARSSIAFLHEVGDIDRRGCCDHILLRLSAESDIDNAVALCMCCHTGSHSQRKSHTSYMFWYYIHCDFRFLRYYHPGFWPNSG